MPHPVAAERPPSPAPAPSLPPVRSLPPLLAQARAHAARAFRSQVSSVLRHASVACLRRSLSRRAREHLQSLPEEELVGSSSTEELMRLDPSVLKVTEGDVERCYGFAERVGKRWAEVLRRQGYGEFAEIALDVAKRGRYLEDPVSSDDVPAHDGNDVREEEHKASKFASAYTALHALRRYPPECDGSGLPSQYLPVHDSEGEEISSVRRVIQQIDEMSRNGETEWHHGWDAIEEAVERNRKRMEYGTVRSGTSDSKTVPKSDIGMKTGDGEEGGADVAVNAESNMKPRASRKRGRSPETNRVVQFKSDPEEDEEGNAEVGCDKGYSDGRGICTMSQGGRPASSLGDATFSWDDVLGVMSMGERRELVAAAIHPPHPFESEKNGDGHKADEDNKPTETPSEEQHHDAVVCGALKEMGQTHLWEQTRNLSSSDINNKTAGGEETKQNPFEGGNETIYGASEALASFRSQRQLRQQKNTVARAARERLGRRTMIVGEHKPEYARATSHSKVKWSDDDCTRANKSLESGALADSANPQQREPSEQPPQRWLEMDLGECMIELTSDAFRPELGKGEGAAAGEREKRVYAFRSLELALRY